MKTIKLGLVLIGLTLALNVSAQKKEVVKIKTSAECGMCEKAIEKNLSFEKGVKKVDMDLSTKEVTVTFNPKKTNPESIRKAISNMGYDADNVPANNKAYNKLDKCCQKGEHEKQSK
jgi:copper chaperone CopZ